MSPATLTKGLWGTRSSDWPRKTTVSTKGGIVVRRRVWRRLRAQRAWLAGTWGGLFPHDACPQGSMVSALSWVLRLSSAPLGPGLAAWYNTESR